MNAQLQNFARCTLKEGLVKCSSEQQIVFKFMYSSDNQNLSIEKIVDKMSDNELDWAMVQVLNTITKNEKEK